MMLVFECFPARVTYAHPLSSGMGVRVVVDFREEAVMLGQYEGQINWFFGGKVTSELVPIARYNPQRGVFVITILSEDDREQYEVIFRRTESGGWLGRGTVAGWSIDCSAVLFREQGGAIEVSGKFVERYPADNYEGTFTCFVDAAE